MDTDSNRTLLDISRRLSTIENRLLQIETSTSRMDSHVTFITGIYDTVKTPFHKLMSLIDKTMSGISVVDYKRGFENKIKGM